MELKQRLTKIKNNLTSILGAVNTQLVNKGASAVTELEDVATEIGTIQTGITPTGQIEISQNGTYNVTDYASASVAVPNDDSELVGMLDGSITEIKNDNVTSLQQYSLYRRTELIDVEFKNLQSLNNYAFSGCSSLEKADIGRVTYIPTGTFASCTKLEAIILRGASMCQLSGVTSFTGTPFRNGTGGTVYVPQALLNDYRNSTNWSALESTTFLPIEGSEYE